MYLEWSVFGRNFYYFVKCAQLKSISRASKVIGLTQASLSLAIKNLEDEIGEPLFKRLPRGIELTSVGEELFQFMVKQGVEFEENLKQTLGKTTIEEIKIGSAELYLEKLIPFVQKEKTYPIQIYHRSNKDSYRAVEDGLLDFAFINSTSDPVGSLKFEKINSLEIKVVGLKKKFTELKDIQNFEELKNFPWVTTANPYSHWAKALNPRQNGFYIQKESEVKKIILNGLAIGETVLDIFTEREKKLLVVCPIESRYPSANTYVIYPQNIKDEIFAVLEKIIKLF